MVGLALDEPIRNGRSGIYGSGNKYKEINKSKCK